MKKTNKAFKKPIPWLRPDRKNFEIETTGKPDLDCVKQDIRHFQ